MQQRQLTMQCLLIRNGSWVEDVVVDCRKQEQNQGRQCDAGVIQRMRQNSNNEMKVSDGSWQYCETIRVG